MQFQIKNRFTGSVIFTAEIEATDEAPLSIKFGMAVRVAISSGANLSWANLSGADLSKADLSGADLRSFKADFWMILTQNKAEVPALIAALCDGKVDGSTYSGACACLMGTIANVRHVDVRDLECDSGRPAERWFMMISMGDKPGDATGGGYASRMAVEWALEWCALNGIEAKPVAEVAS